MVDWNPVWSFADMVLTCFWRSAWISPRVVSLIAGFSATAALADPAGGVAVGVQEIAIDQTAKTMRKRFMKPAYGRGPDATVNRRRAPPPLPLGGRGAEALVVDVFGDRRVRAADRARRVAPQLDLAERGVES